MPTSWTDIDTLITDVLVDPDHDFWPEAELLKWYNQAAKHQHRQVIDAMKTRPDIDPFSHAYIAYFLTPQTGNFVVGEQDIDQPLDSIEILSVTLLPTAANDVRCQRVPFSDDYRIKGPAPQFRPTPRRPLWTVTDEGKIRVYFATDDTKATVAMPYVVRYIREIIDTAIGGDADLPEPYNTGPIQRTIGTALTRQQTDPQPYYDQADFVANNILPRKVEQPAMAR